MNAPRIKPTRRFKARGANAGKPGFWASADWEFDEAHARQTVQKIANNPAYKDVELVSMRRMPNGHWTDFQKERFVPAGEGEASR